MASSPMGTTPDLSSGKSALVTTAFTPGSAAAAETEKVFCDRIHELLFRHLKEELELSTLRVEGIRDRLSLCLLCHLILRAS